MDENQEEVSLVINGTASGLKLGGLCKITGVENTAIENLTFNKKRVYSNQCADIAETWAEILSIDEVDDVELLLTIANLLNQSVNHQIISLVSLEESLELIVDPILKTVYKYCDENYKIETRITTPNEELIWHRDHIIGLLTAAYLYRFISPIILGIYGENEKLGDCGECLAEFFLKILKKISVTCYDRPVKLENKLHRLVSARVASTEYTDMLIWSYLSNVGLSQSQQIHAIYSRVITDIIPKLKLTENVLTFLYVVLKRQLSFSFRSKLPKEYSSFNSLLEADSASVFDKSGNYSEHDELLLTEQEFAIDDAINRVKRTFHVDIEESIQEFKPTEERNIVLYAILSKYIFSMEIIGSLTKEKYSYIMSLIITILEKYHLNELAKLMYAEVGERATMTTSKEKALEKRLAVIREEKRYKEVVSQVYSIIGERADTANPITRIFELAFKTAYVDSEEDEVEINLEILEQNLLMFIKLIV
jgi:hypothetical protein